MAVRDDSGPMPCLICGETKTVRSHIIPKAIVAKIAADENGVVVGSRFHQGAKPMPRGTFSNDILCAEHEALTAGLDKYGVEFLRRADQSFIPSIHRSGYPVANPDPRKLSRFALSLIWREVAAGGPGKRTLGPYAEAVKDAVFSDGPLDWPLVIQRQNIVVRADRVEIGVNPYFVRLGGKRAWTIGLAGYAFFVVSDRQGFDMAPGWLRANESDPATIVVGDEMPIQRLGSFAPIFRNMARKDPRR